MGYSATLRDLIVLLKHHTSDALEAFEKQEMQVIKASLRDLDKLANDLVRYVESEDGSDIDEIAEWITGDPDVLFEKRTKQRLSKPKKFKRHQSDD